jgi:anaerobic glycerol-3-phosphate dehydrogenase
MDELARRGEHADVAAVLGSNDSATLRTARVTPCAVRSSKTTLVLVAVEGVVYDLVAHILRARLANKGVEATDDAVRV